MGKLYYDDKNFVFYEYETEKEFEELKDQAEVMFFKSSK